MKLTSRLPILSAVLAGLAVLVPAAPARAGDLVVVVSHVGSATGEVLCALHAEASGFPGAGAAVATRALKADPEGVTCRFPALRAGPYAVAVFHDLNGNRKLDTTILGLPAEDWRVSNNVRPSLRAPTFAEAQVSVGETGPTTVDVRLGR